MPTPRLRLVAPRRTSADQALRRNRFFWLHFARALRRVTPRQTAPSLGSHSTCSDRTRRNFSGASHFRRLSHATRPCFLRGDCRLLLPLLLPLLLLLLFP